MVREVMFGESCLKDRGYATRVQIPLLWRSTLVIVLFMLLAYILLGNIEDLGHEYGFLAKSIFILAGQSNMSGRGGVVNNTWDGMIPPESHPNHLVLQLSANLTWKEAHEPLHEDIDVNKTCGIGPGLAFANYLLDKDSGFGPIGLVPCAIGGRGLREWQRGTSLYNETVNRARSAMRDGGVIRGLLWYQGETETLDKTDAELYKKGLEKFFTDIRSDLFSPMLPIVQVALGSGPGPYLNTVRAAQFGTNLPNVKCIEARGLELDPYLHLHLTSSGQVQLGKMLADAFLQIVKVPVQGDAPKRDIICVGNKGK